MTYFSFRVLFICIFFPPVLYIFSVQGLEQYLQNKKAKQVQSIVIQDFEAVYSGRYSITEEISTNLERYAREDKLRSLGVITKIVVSTKKRKLNIFEAIFSYSGRIYFRKVITQVSCHKGTKTPRL